MTSFKQITALVLLQRCLVAALDKEAEHMPRKGTPITKSAWQQQGEQDRFAALVPAECNSSQLTHDFASDYYSKVVDKNGGVRLEALRLKYAYGRIKELPAGSGSGSDMGRATAQSLEFLRNVIPKYKIRTVVDAPCGDTTWIFHAWETESLAQYIGLDVVRAVIRLNSMRFAHHANKHFARWDFVACGIPQMQTRGGAVVPVDMVHMRDVLQHLSVKSGMRAIKGVCAAGVRYLVTTTYNQTFAGGKRTLKDTKTNDKDAVDGGWYPNNLALPPFNLPTPLSCVQTHPHIEPDFTCLYDLLQWPACSRRRTQQRTA